MMSKRTVRLLTAGLLLLVTLDGVIVVSDFHCSLSLQEESQLVQGELPSLLSLFPEPIKDSDEDFASAMYLKTQLFFPSDVPELLSDPEGKLRTSRFPLYLLHHTLVV